MPDSAQLETFGTAFSAPRSRGARLVRRCAPLLVAAMIVTGPVASSASAATPAPQPPTASQSLTPTSGMLFGALAGVRGTQDADASTAALESSIGRKFDIQRIFTGWDGPMPPNEVLDALSHGRTPVLSIEPYRLDGTKVPWAEIASGAHDAEIRAHAAAIASLAVPVFLVFHHEPDYATGYGTPADYRAAYRHYVEVFRAAGVTNVAWTWVLTPASFGPTPSTVGADALYPGDDVVDWAGLDAYNFFTCKPATPKSWRSMATAAGAFRTWGQTHAKPLMVAEYGSIEDPADPGRKAQWYKDSMATLSSWPEIKAISVFNKTGSCPWWIDSSPAALSAFAATGSLPAAHGRVSAWLRAPKVIGSSPWSMTFDASRSTGSGAQTGAGIASWTVAFGDGTASASGQGTPPSALAHTYAAGTWTARLTATDATGATATDTLAVTSAPAPGVSLMERDVHGESATLRAWVDPHGLAGTVQLTWGPVTGYEHSGPVLSIGANATGFDQPITGLVPGASYTWRASATTSAGTASATHTFATPGPPTSSTSWVESRATTSVTIGAQVHSHRLATSTWVEYGTSTALGSRSATARIDPLTYEKTVRQYLTGLRSGTTYWYRIAASNSRGGFTGPLVSFTTR